MNRKSLIVLPSALILLILFTASTAFAQAARPAGQAPRPATPQAPPPIVNTHKVFLDGIGGVTFEHEPGGMFGAGVSFVTSRNVQVFGEFGRVTNILPAKAVDTLNAAAKTFVANGATAFAYDAKMPGYYGLGGVRLAAKMSRVGIAPFVDVGAGFAHVSSRITAHSAGTDMTSAFLASLSIAPTETKPMFSGGGGLTIAAGKRAMVDLGYRFSRILSDVTAITTNRFYVAYRLGV